MPTLLKPPVEAGKETFIHLFCTSRHEPVENYNLLRITSKPINILRGLALCIVEVHSSDGEGLEFLVVRV